MKLTYLIAELFKKLFPSKETRDVKKLVTMAKEITKNDGFVHEPIGSFKPLSQEEFDQDRSYLKDLLKSHHEFSKSIESNTKANEVAVLEYFKGSLNNVDLLSALKDNDDGDMFYVHHSGFWIWREAKWNFLGKMKGTPYPAFLDLLPNDAIQDLQVSFNLGPDFNQPISTDSSSLKKEADVVFWPTPDTVLGEDYGPVIQWNHQDDLFINFQVLDMVVVEEKNLFLRYVGHELILDERKEFPYHIYPCFIETKELISSIRADQLQQIGDDQYAIIVVFQEEIGLILIGAEDWLHLQRLIYGMDDDEETKSHFELHYMRFDKKVVEKIKFSHPISNYYNYGLAEDQQLRMNFAKFTPIEKTRTS